MDKFENERFTGTCPTCHQPFLVDKIIMLRHALAEAKNLIEYMHDVTILIDSNKDIETYSNKYANIFNLIDDVLKVT